MNRKIFALPLLVSSFLLLTACGHNHYGDKHSVPLTPQQQTLASTAGRLKSGTVTINVASDMHDSQRNHYEATARVKFIRQPFALSETAIGNRQDIWTEYHDFDEGQAKVALSAQSFKKGSEDDTVPLKSDTDNQDHKRLDKYLVGSKINDHTMISKIFTLPRFSLGQMNLFKKSKQLNAIQYTYHGKSQQLFDRFAKVAPLFVGAYANNGGYLWNYERINKQDHFYYSSKDYAKPTDDGWLDMGTYERYLQTKDQVKIKQINLIYTFEKKKLRAVLCHFEVKDLKQRDYSITLQYDQINRVKPFKIKE